MADFTASFTGGVALERWTDPPSGARPSRINPLPNRPHLRRVGVTGAPITIRARVAGVTGPMDAALGGRLFVAWLAEYPSAVSPPIVKPAGQSSVRTFTPTMAGHYTFVLRRAGGGGVILHVDVVD